MSQKKQKIEKKTLKKKTFHKIITKTLIKNYAKRYFTALKKGKKIKQIRKRIKKFSKRHFLTFNV